MTGCDQGPSWEEYNACKENYITAHVYENCNHLRPSAP